MKKILILNFVLWCLSQQNDSFEEFYENLKELEADCNLKSGELEIDVPYFYRVTAYYGFYSDKTVRKTKLKEEIKADEEVKKNLEGIYKFLESKLHTKSKKPPVSLVLDNLIKNKIVNETDEQLKEIFVRISQMNIDEFKENWRNILLQQFAKEYCFKVSMENLLETIDNSALSVILLLHHGKNQAYKSNIITIHRKGEVVQDIEKQKINYKLWIIVGLVAVFIVICLLIFFMIKLKRGEKQRLIYTVE